MIENIDKTDLDLLQNYQNKEVVLEIYKCINDLKCDYWLLMEVC